MLTETVEEMTGIYEEMFCAVPGNSEVAQKMFQNINFLGKTSFFSFYSFLL